MNRRLAFIQGNTGYQHGVASALIHCPLGKTEKCLFPIAVFKDQVQGNVVKALVRHSAPPPVISGYIRPCTVTSKCLDHSILMSHLFRNNKTRKQSQITNQKWTVELIVADSRFGRVNIKGQIAHKMVEGCALNDAYSFRFQRYV